MGERRWLAAAGAATAGVAVAGVAVAVAVAALVLAGCGGAGPGPAGGARVSPPAQADALVLRVAELPGMLPPGGTAGILPTYSLYGDGRLVTPARGTPTGVWPGLVEYRLTAGEVRGVLQLAADNGLLDRLPATPAGPDAPVVVVTVVSGGVRRTGRLARTDRAATRLHAELARHATGAGTPYLPAAVAVVASATGGPEPGRVWPLPPLAAGQALTGPGAGSRCSLLRGADVDAARTATAGADPATTWRSGDQLWTLTIRPLLPDEPDCTAL